MFAHQTFFSLYGNPLGHLRHIINPRRPLHFAQNNLQRLPKKISQFQAEKIGPFCEKVSWTE